MSCRSRGFRALVGVLALACTNALAQTLPVRTVWFVS